MNIKIAKFCKKTKFIKNKTLVYLAFVVGTTVFALYEYRRSQQEQKEESSRNLLFPDLKPLEIKTVVLTDEKTGQQIFLSRRGDKSWQVGKRVTDIADRDIVEDWLSTLLKEKVQLIKQEGADWAEYGLDKDMKSIEITTNDEKRIKINISHYSAFDGSFYIRKADSLLLGGTGYAHLTGKKEDYFRSYKLINKLSHPSFIKYRSSSFSAEVKWENNRWQWGAAEVLPNMNIKNQKGDEDKAQASFQVDDRGGHRGSFPLSHPDLESYWSALKNINFGREIYSNTEHYREKLKLNRPPIVELTIGFPKELIADETDQKGNKEKEKSLSEEGLEVKIYSSVPDQSVPDQAEELYYVQVSNRDDIFVLSRDKGEEIFLTEQKIRDHSYPFQFDRKKLAFIDIKGYGVDFSFKKKKGEWSVIEEDSEKQIKKSSKEGLKALDTEQLEEILNKIPRLSVKQYFEKDKAFEKAGFMVLKGQEGQNLLRLDLSTPFDVENPLSGNLGTKDKAGLPKKGNKLEDLKRVLVQSSRGQEVMAVPWEEVQDLFPSQQK